VRSEHMLDHSARRVNLYPGRTTANRPPTRSGPTGLHKDAEVSPGARRDRQRYYDFPDLAAFARASQTAMGNHTPAAVQVRLGSITYNLSRDGAETLLRDGMLRGVILDTAEADGPLSSLYVESSESGTQKRYPNYCHRCHHRWFSTPLRSSFGEATTHNEVCPACQASDWNEYLLLRCTHCRAVFESEQIRYEIGSYTYGAEKSRKDGALCPPYELFPLCPYCGTAHWCPAEEIRVHDLRERAAEQAARVRMVWIGVAVFAVMLAGVVMWGILR